MNGTDKEQAFSLLEILIVLAISITVVLLTTANLEGYRQSSLLADTSREIVNTIQEAKSKTLAGESGLSYKAHFTTTTYELWNQTNAVIKRTTIDKVLQIVPPAGDITFAKVTGKSNGGTVLVRVQNSTLTKTITVSSIGSISEQ